MIDINPVYNPKWDAYYERGLKEDRGTGCYHKAFKAFEKAAEMGHAEAIYRLGVMYYRGRGVDQSLEESRALFKRAAEKGNNWAMRRYLELKDLKEIPDGDYVCNSITIGSLRHVEKRQAKCPKCDLKCGRKHKMNIKVLLLSTIVTSSLWGASSDFDGARAGSPVRASVQASGGAGFMHVEAKDKLLKDSCLSFGTEEVFNAYLLYKDNPDKYLEMLKLRQEYEFILFVLRNEGSENTREVYREQRGFQGHAMDILKRLKVLYLNKVGDK